MEDDIFKIIVPLNNNYSFDANTKKESETKIHLSVNQEKILQEATSTEEKQRAEQEIIRLSACVKTVDDMVALDEAIQDLLMKNS